MAVWLIRAGSQGQFEQIFLNEKRVNVIWNGLNQNLANWTPRSHWNRS
jgi:restriction system protein